MYARQLSSTTDAGFGGSAQYRRRLSDRIEEAFEQACDQGQAEVAACMLKALDLLLLGRPLPWNRRQAALSVLRACQARLEHLRTTQNEAGEADQAAEPGAKEHSLSLV